MSDPSNNSNGHNTDGTSSTGTSDAGLLPGTIAPAPTPATMSETGVSSTGHLVDENGSPRKAKQSPTKVAGDDDKMGSPSKAVATVPPAKFVVTVSDVGRKFTLNLSQIHTESTLLKDNFLITGIELANADPEAFAIIHNWFNGHMGEPPVDKVGRKRFYEATALAKGLGLKECEAQLKVVNKKIAYALCDLFNDEMSNGTRATMDEIQGRVKREVGSYMSRSINTGGAEEDWNDMDSDVFEMTY